MILTFDTRLLAAILAGRIVRTKNFEATLLCSCGYVERRAIKTKDRDRGWRKFQAK